MINLQKPNFSTTYNRKAKDSFKSKWNLFVFQAAMKGKTSLSNEKFEGFKIEDSIVKTYTTKYWQKKTDEKIGNLTVEEIYANIKNLEDTHKSFKVDVMKDYCKDFENIFSEKEFKDLIEKDCCEYCGMNDETLGKLYKKGKITKKNLRGWKLEVDRKKPNHEYTKENCVMACYWCNNAKTDEFTHEEFIPIGEAFGETWKKD